jgi:hypothetical protein
LFAQATSSSLRYLLQVFEGILQQAGSFIKQHILRFFGKLVIVRLLDGMAYGFQRIEKAGGLLLIPRVGLDCFQQIFIVIQDTMDLFYIFCRMPSGNALEQVSYY